MFKIFGVVRHGDVLRQVVGFAWLNRLGSFALLEGLDVWIGRGTEDSRHFPAVLAAHSHRRQHRNATTAKRYLFTHRVFIHRP